MKHNSSVLIGVISAIIAIITGVLKFGSYLYNIAYLNYWNIDPKFFSIPETYWLEDIALSFILLLFGVIIVGFMNEISITYKKYNIYIKYFKKTLKNSKLSNFEYKSKQKKEKEPIDVFENTRIELEPNEFNEAKKECTVLKIVALIQYILYIILFQFLWAIIMCIAYLKIGSINNSSLLEFILLTQFWGLLIVLTSYFLAGIEKDKIKEKSIKDLIKTDVKNFELPMFPIRKIYKLGVRHFLSNNHIFHASIIMFAVFLSFLFIEHDLGKQDSHNLKNNVLITKYDNSDYAIIAKSSDSIIAEKIEINNKDAIIYVNDQIIISNDIIKMKKYSFDNISKRNN